MSKKPHIVGAARDQQFQTLLYRITSRPGKWTHISKSFCITRKERRETYRMIIETLKLMSLEYESPPRTYKIRLLTEEMKAEKQILSFSQRYGYAYKNTKTVIHGGGWKSP